MAKVEVGQLWAKAGGSVWRVEKITNKKILVGTEEVIIAELNRNNGESALMYLMANGEPYYPQWWRIKEAEQTECGKCKFQNFRTIYGNIAKSK